MKSRSFDSFESVILFVIYIALQDKKFSEEEKSELLIDIPLIKKYYFDCYGEFIKFDAVEQIKKLEEQIKNNNSITITDPNMTRFMMTLQNAVDLVLYAFKNGKTGDIFVQKAPSTTIGELALIMREIYKSKSKIKNIGIRHGEKIHETLLSQEERIVSEDLGNYFRIPADNRDLNYDKYFSKGVKSPNYKEFNSFNTIRLKKQELINLLASIGYK